MFNGIILNTGTINYIKRNKKSLDIQLKTDLKFSKKDLGASVSCNGVCLTITRIKGSLINFYVSGETLNRSNFKNIKKGQILNLEKSLSYGQKLSGHFVQGHVDTTAKICNIEIVDKSWIIKFQLENKKLNKFLLEKASITINGVSLTISKVYFKYFEINIIPHTLELTNLKNLKKNYLVNVELDILGKYIYKYYN